MTSQQGGEGVRLIIDVRFASHFALLRFREIDNRPIYKIIYIITM